MHIKKSIRFDLSPDGGGIEEADQKSSRFLKTHGFSKEAVDTQVMILRELIHNGLKYGKCTRTEDKMAVNISIEEYTITLEVQNSVDETCCERLKELDKTIQFIRGYQDPFEAYMLKQKEAFQDTSSSESNGLGLARIAYEGNAVLDFFVSEDNILNLYAVRNLDGRFEY
jgi:hypothetical protein